MHISKEEFEKRMAIYRKITPRLDWFTSSEQEELVFKAGKNSRDYNSNFLVILENIAFMESIKRGKKDPVSV
jgi:hypothetical protein